jgi:hypothetical protein
MTIRRYDKNYHSVGMVIDNSEDEEDIMFCEQCQKNGTVSKLKERLYLDDKGKALPPPPDASDFVQCWECGLVVPLRKAKKQGKISGIQGIEILDNPYDYGKSQILGNDSKHRYQRLRKRQAKHPDKEVQKLIDDGFELKSYQHDIPN